MKFKDLYIAIFFIFLFQPASANGTWKVLKTGAGGWMTGMDIHHSGEPVYARSDVGSAYRWEESTLEWTNIVTSDNIPSSDIYWNDQLGVLSLVSAPSNNNIAYLSFYNCVYRSTNKGDNWTRTAFPNIFMPPNDDRSKYSGERLAVDPINENIVYFGSVNNGLFVTQNGGQTWNQIGAIPLGTADRGVSEIKFDPSGGSANGKSNVIYVVVDGAGAFRSNNGGATWTNISSGLGITNEFMDVDVSPNGMFYVCITDGGSNHAVKRYFNGSWSTVTPPTGLMINDIACDPNNSNRIFAKSLGNGPFYSSTNATGTPSWNSHTHSRTGSDIPWHDWTEHGWISVGEMVVDPVQPNRLWLAEGVGVFITTDINDSDMAWSSVSSGQEHMVSNHLVVLNNQTLIQAFWDRPMFVRDANNLDSYPTRHYPSSRFSSTWDMGVTPADPNFVVAITEDHRYCCYNDGLHRNSGYSTDGGQTWTRFGSMPDPTNDYGVFGNISVASNDINNIVWLPTGNRMPFYSTNRGVTWTQVTIPGNSGNCCIVAPWFIRKVLVADNVLANTFYIYDFGNGKVYRSTNGGASWTTRSSSLPASAYHGKLRAVPGKAGHLIFSAGQNQTESVMTGIYHSTDGGVSWNFIANTDKILNVAVGKEAPGSNYPTIFVHGNANGVLGYHMSTDQGATWTQIGTYPAGIYSWSKVMVADPFKYGRLYVGFGGHSFVYFDINSNCPNAGTPCDDNNPKTINDVYDNNCVCAGTCPLVGTVCDDNDPSTTNDQEDGNCGCVGVPCPAAGTTCDDNDPNTTNDIEDGFCTCAGTPINVSNSGICRFDTPPVLDGDDTEWPMDSIFYPTKVLGGTVAGPSDLNAEFKIGWDDNYLYVFGRVTDDALFNDSPNPWNDDCFELYIDGGNEKLTTYDANDFQLMFRYNDPVAYNFPNGPINPPGLDFVMQPTNLGYNVEIRASWAFIGIPPISTGGKIGVDVHINDDDDGGLRDKFISWNDDLNLAWTNPSVFGEILFEDCQSEFITPNICLWMEGAYDYNTNQLTTLLMQRNLLPYLQPYNTPPWNHMGTESVSNFPPQAVDWVKVSFRSNPSKSSEVLATAALLLEDGCLFFPAKDFFPESLGASFYVVVEHRNHIGIMSPTAINVTQNTLTFDFRNIDSYSVGGQGQKLIGTGVWAMFAGDGDQLLDLNGYDINGIDNASWAPLNGGFNVYGYADYNLDGDISGLDKVLWSANNGIYSALDR